jgi:hypothetical protein
MSTLAHHMAMMGLGTAINADAVSIYSKLVAWWPCNETTGAKLNDAHTHGLNGDIAAAGSAITFSVASVRSGGPSSILFNGDARANLPTNLDAYIAGANDHAVFTWYRPIATTSGAAAREIICSYNTGSGGSSAKNDQFGLYVDATGHPTSNWRYGSSSATQGVASTRTVATSTNTFIGYNKLTTPKTVQHWKDGASETAIGYTNEPTGTSLEPTISGMTGQVTFQAAGALQELTLFNTSLTSSEIAWLYNGGAGRSYADLKTASGH